MRISALKQSSIFIILTWSNPISSLAAGLCRAEKHWTRSCHGTIAVLRIMAGLNIQLMPVLTTYTLILTLHTGISHFPFTSKALTNVDI